MTQVAVRLDDQEVAELDRMVRAGVFPSRAAAIRAALADQRRAEENRRLAQAYHAAYGERPQSAAGAGVGAGSAAIAEFYADEPPWDDQPDDPAR